MSNWEEWFRKCEQERNEILLCYPNGKYSNSTLTNDTWTIITFIVGIKPNILVRQSYHEGLSLWSELTKQ